MIIDSLINNGFPDTWQHGRFNKEVCIDLINQVEKVLPDSKNFYLDTLFLDPNKKIDVADVEYLFLIGLVDPSLDACRPLLSWYDQIKSPAWPEVSSIADYDNLADHIKTEIVNQHGININRYRVLLNDFYSRCKNIVEIGYTTSNLGVPLDFAALFVANTFDEYHESELELNLALDRYFLCYQLKPHPHRQYLRHLLNQSSIKHQGLMTLAKNTKVPYQYPGLEEVVDPCRSEIEKYKGLNDLAKFWTGTHDTCSLGSLTTWTNSFLIVTSETTYDGVRPHISEKTYKPIIGLRPFVINGDPKIYKWLEHWGFDTFEDQWPWVDFRSYSGFEDHCSKIMSVLQYVCSKSPDEIKDWYQQLMPRLLKNKTHFFEHVKNQLGVIDNIGEYLNKFTMNSQSLKVKNETICNQ